MEPRYNKIHLKFKLNGFNFDHEELKEVAYSLVKEGMPYEQIIGDFLLDWLDEKDYLEIKTSGSTGLPKTFKIKKQAMVHSAITTGDFFKFEPGDTALHSLPTQFIAGKMMLVRAMILGLELDMVEPSSHPVFDYEKAYDFGAMVPFQLQNSIKYLDNIKTIIIGGAPASKQLIDAIQDCRANIFETFGMTETVSHIAVRKLNNFGSSDQISTSYFKALSGITISQDKRECLVINAPHLSDESIITNDMIKLHSDTAFEWLGRYDNIINSGGVKICPEQVEKKLEEYIDQRFFIASEEDEHLGEKVILVVEDEGAQINSSAYKKLGKYEVPKEIYFISKFVQTPAGKVQRTETLELVFKK